MKQKTKIAKPKKKNAKHYIKMYVASLFIGMTIFIAGDYFLKPPPPCANSRSCISDLSASIDNNMPATFEGHTIMPPTIDPAVTLHKPTVLGANVPSEEKHIYVDLSTQTLYAYEGNKLIMQAYISSGKWGKTPVGNFHIWEKLRATRMAGGEGASAYDLPNVPWTMYFYHDFGLHGAYWHNNFGHAMSHGCINLRIVDAETLFNWADGPTGNQLGTAVSVCNQFTQPNMCIQNQPIQ